MSNFPDSHHQMAFGFIDFPPAPLHDHNLPSPLRCCDTHRNVSLCHNALTKKARESAEPGPASRAFTVRSCLSLWPMVQARPLHIVPCHSDQKFYLIHLDINNDGVDGGGSVTKLCLCVNSSASSGYSLLRFRREGDGDANNENTC